MMGTDCMGIHNDALSRTHALAQTEEPTAEMIAASEAEVSHAPFVTLGVSEELSGGAGAMYLREIANHDLLNQNDEVLLAQRMQAGREAAARLTADEALSDLERERLKRVVADGDAARRHLIESNLRLVVSVTRR